ncbi:MAG: NADH-quinone oxidoreductase subunit L [Chloroflexi bacterium]|nr:NADH-quinone oxidoreductase subunit L [Chloroflexota bacterium]
MFQLLWLIPALPLLSFFAIVLFANPNKRLSSNIAIGAIGLSWLISWAVVFRVVTTPHFELVDLPLAWMPAGDKILHLGVMVDPFTAIMLFMVPFVCTMIFVYSQGYMQGDPRYSRFFAYVSLFTAGMLGLVVADNLLLAFISWEVMGLCSYLLIGFWFEKPSAMNAAKKAFMTTRIGDVLLFLGMAYLYGQTGTLTFKDIFRPEVMEKLAQTTVSLGPLGTQPVAVIIALLIFGGAVGKSAQFPLHVWLPDAMEGPTPVSALIHAATMVAAGVYVVARTLPIFAAVEGSSALVAVGFIGAFTAFAAATIAIAQDDIKRVLAYSTISQLGYMMMALGIGGFVAGVFHLITHAFFKALLFLGSGSVIHSVEHGHHAAAEANGEHPGEHEEHFDANDMMNMGGLRTKMPATFWTYIIGTLALAGVAPLSGFWSKDEILAEAFGQFMHKGVASLPFFVWLMGTLGAVLTAFYMGRQIGLVFWGKPRTAAAEHTHESPASMTAPLIALAAFTLVLGFMNVPENFPLIGNGWLHHFIGEVFAAAHLEFEAVPFNFLVGGLSTLLALLGLGAGWALYKDHPAGAPDPLARPLGPIWRVLRNKYYVDEFYSATVVRGTIAFASLCYKFDDSWVIDPIVDWAGKGTAIFATANRLFDTHVIDGTVNFIGIFTHRWGDITRRIQTGRVQNYLVVAMASALALFGVFLMR